MKTISDGDDIHTAIEDDMKGEKLKEDLALDRQIGRNARRVCHAGERGLSLG